MTEVSETFFISLPKPKLNKIEKEKEHVIAGHPILNYSFVDKLWSFEIAGGVDQHAPLTVINVKKNGLAKRSGIKIGDEIMYINNISTENMTLLEAQVEIQEAGRSLKIIVRGDNDESSNSSEDEATVDFWFKPMNSQQLDLVEWYKKREEKRRMTQQLYQGFPWNDRKKPNLRSSNCFMAVNNKPQEREIKLKVSKERYIENEKERLSEIESKRLFY
ncbi:CLUMA_CG015353, isoform A [Clunio marinus]|uniref:CLUMA_CG015353, isoform A n=1 Tax=Clunio marinus TaxID=568069 RepID=A0A1J1IQ80_9DIPT|nr:CLUMA_CG015353, isoform A [Clunio marinus]